LQQVAKKEVGGQFIAGKAANNTGERHWRVALIKLPDCDDVPAGLSAVTSVPGAYGFVALYVLSGVMEFFPFAARCKEGGRQFR
jgi:hypothetical protein